MCSLIEEYCKNDKEMKILRENVAACVRVTEINADANYKCIKVKAMLHSYISAFMMVNLFS